MSTIRIEFAPGHEEEHLRVANATLKDERPQIVEAALLKMKAAEQMYEALRPFASYACSPLGQCACHNCRARDAMIAAAEGRTHQESAS